MPDPRLAQATIPPVALTGLLELADVHGLATERWFTGTGLDRDRLEEPRALVSYRQAVTVIRRALADLPSGPSGLLVGNRDPLLSWGTLGTAVRSASTGAEAIGIALEYHQGSGTLMDYGVTRTPEGSVITLLARTHEPDLQVFLTEEALGGIVVLARVVFGRATVPLRAELAYPAPAWAAAYERFWRCPVVFGADRTALTMPTGLEERRIPTANATQLEAALGATRAMLGADVVADIVRTVESTLRRDLRVRPTATQVAHGLGMSARTLHRHLADAGEAFGALQDRVRRQQADALLQQTRRSIASIAAELGYGDPRDFRRAYKRWTGHAPSETRRPRG